MYKITERQSIAGKLYRCRCSVQLLHYDTDQPYEKYWGLNVHSEPGGIALATGRVLMFVENGWTTREYEILYGETVGWVPAKYLRSAPS